MIEVHEDPLKALERAVQLAGAHELWVLTGFIGERASEILKPFRSTRLVIGIDNGSLRVSAAGERELGLLRSLGADIRGVKHFIQSFIFFRAASH